MELSQLQLFRNKIDTGSVFGIFMKTCDPAFVETAGYAGCDFAVLDMEHGPIGMEQMQNNIRAAEAAGILPIVRVESLSEQWISKALDIGAAGVQIPQVSTAGDARRAVQAAKFYPGGERGVCRFVRAARYSSKPKAQYFQEANETLVIIQLEGLEGVENLEEILQVEGVDILFIGPYDLSQSMGLTGQTSHPLVVEQMRRIVEKARALGVAVGAFTEDESSLKTWMDAGVRYLSYSVDVGVFFEACSAAKQRYLRFLSTPED